MAEYDYGSLIQTYDDIATGYNQMSKEQSAGYGYPTRSTVPGPGFTGSYSTPRGNLVTIGAPTRSIHDRGRGVSGPSSYGDNRISRDIGGPGRVEGPAYGAAGPTMPKPSLSKAKFDSPGKLKFDQYKPPERDPMEEKKLRQEYMAPGMRQVRRTTQESILSSKSFDNPNARSLFIQKALEGVGGAVSQIAGQAGKQAAAEATSRYAMELDKYHTGFKVGQDEKRANWEAAWDAAVMEFAAKNQQNLSEYSAAMNIYGNQSAAQQIEGAGGGSYGSGRSQMYQDQLAKQIEKTWG
jgi:hypothetical protein